MAAVWLIGAVPRWPIYRSPPSWWLTVVFLRALALSPDGKWVAYYGETLPRGSQATDCPLWTVMG